MMAQETKNRFSSWAGSICLSVDGSSSNLPKAPFLLSEQTWRHGCCHGTVHLFQENSSKVGHLPIKCLCQCAHSQGSTSCHMAVLHFHVSGTVIMYTVIKQLAGRLCLVVKPWTGGSSWCLHHMQVLWPQESLLKPLSQFSHCEHYFYFIYLAGVCCAYSLSRWHYCNANIVEGSLWIRISSQLFGLHLFSVVGWLQNKV